MIKDLPCHNCLTFVICKNRSCVDQFLFITQLKVNCELITEIIDSCSNTKEKLLLYTDIRKIFDKETYIRPHQLENIQSSFRSSIRKLNARKLLKKKKEEI